MHPLVRDLYKRVVFVGREYPLGLPWVRRKAKDWFRQNKELTDEVEIRRAVAKGRFWVREMRAIIQLKKYRTMNKRYGRNAHLTNTEILEQVEKAIAEDMK
mmetsp:Transcript_1765/g.2344  ORF Transcript_1765/g.2344 Transcript_1765/m.2344 type:complete len:101 (-) Transcript_1765:1076-1378(-)